LPSSKYCSFLFQPNIPLSAWVIGSGIPSYDDAYHNGSDNCAQHDGPYDYQEDVFAGGTINGHTTLFQCQCSRTLRQGRNQESYFATCHHRKCDHDGLGMWCTLTILDIFWACCRPRMMLSPPCTNIIVAIQNNTNRCLRCRHHDCVYKASPEDGAREHAADGDRKPNGSLLKRLNQQNSKSRTYGEPAKEGAPQLYSFHWRN
jgi:hypothetical protein